MIEVRYPNGVVLEYDETIQVGSIITAYQAGFHRVDKVTPRNGSTPTFTYTQILREDGSASPKRINTCDASYCQHMTEDEIEALYTAQTDAATNLRNQLMFHLHKEK